MNSNSTIEAADIVALFFAMDLVSCGSHYGDICASKTASYQSLKAVLAACEQCGQYSTSFLAAEVLIAVYEMGHGLYPAAYISVGNVSRICYAIGLHNKRLATQLPRKVDTWVEIEGRRRLWWAVIILDRYVNVGFTFRPLCVPTIPPNEVIPACDDMWDEGELSVNPLLVMSIEAKTKVSPYARTCQAAHLLGRAIGHANEHADPSDDDFHFQEAHQIQRAACALLSILEQEYNDLPEGHRRLNAIALCYSTLLAIYKVHACIEIDPIESGGQNRGMRIELQQLAIDGYKQIAPKILAFLTAIRQAVSKSVEFVSPFIFHCLFQAGDHFAWTVRENGSESHLAHLNEIRETLKTLQARWSVAGETQLSKASK